LGEWIDNRAKLLISARQNFVTARLSMKFIAERQV